jgi:hypothetical protein
MDMYNGQMGLGGPNYAEQKKKIRANLSHIMNYTDSTILRAQFLEERPSMIPEPVEN